MSFSVPPSLSKILPEKQPIITFSARISYKTKLGEILTTTKVGDKIKLPGLGDRTVKAVSALPETMRKELAEEA